MYKVNVNEHYNFELSAVSDTIQLYGKDLAVDIRPIGNGLLHFLYKNKSYTAEVVSHDTITKKLVVKINSRTYDIAIEDSFDLLLKEMGMISGIGKIALEVKAPMPGLVLSVNITVGQQIKKGDSLLVLEAMKMENMLKSATEGIVKKVLVNTGDKVEKNQILIELE